MQVSLEDRNSFDKQAKASHFYQKPYDTYIWKIRSKKVQITLTTLLTWTNYL